MTPADPLPALSPYRLPAATRLGGVRLQVANLDRSLAWYEDMLGLRLKERAAASATLSAGDGTSPLVELQQNPRAAPVPPQGRLGLYHFAVLLPTRADLGRLLAHLRDRRARAGAADHLVSEALYLSDPDGLGVEVYADRPRATWRRNGDELAMASLPLDFDSLLDAAADTTWSGLPAGAVIGHVHLHVGDLGVAEAFFGSAIGMDVTMRRYPGALFLAAGGYHHHLGTNTWAGAHALKPAPDDARLLEWRIIVPGPEDVALLASHLTDSGHEVIATADGALVVDPWGTAIRIRSDGDS